MHNSESRARETHLNNDKKKKKNSYFSPYSDVSVVSQTCYYYYYLNIYRKEHDVYVWPSAQAMKVYARGVFGVRLLKPPMISLHDGYDIHHRDLCAPRVNVYLSIFYLYTHTHSAL